MKRKVLGVGLFCVLLFAAILAGYWDMLNTEKLTLVRDSATSAVGEIGDVVQGKPAAPADAPPATSPDVAAVTPAVPAGETTPRTSSDPAANAAGAPAETPIGTEATKAAAAGAAPPAFDILRVEPDGSTVLAGTAPAGATVSLRDGTTTLGTEVADASGAFVVVLDKPLAVGDHQIQIDAKTVDGRAVTSAETAIVSIPEKGRENELLAMVESPDKASRLISVPTAAPTAPGTEAPVAGATPPSGETPDVAGTPSAADPSSATADAGVPAVGGAAPAVSDAPATQLATAAPATTSPAVATPAPTAVAPASLSVDAVEIEDDTVYVAGSAVGSAAVRIYLDNGFVAAADRLPDDRFLMTAKAAIATGDHTVRADALDKAGMVIARVEVPFFKPEGRAMSAVSAPAAPGAEAPAASAAPAASTAVASNNAPAAASAPAAGTPPAAPAATPGSTTSPAPAAEAPAATPAAPSAQTAPSPAATTPTAPSNPAAAPAIAGATPAPANAAPTDIAVIRQPALESVNARVIIRRGDSLWRISRNTYGRGARYTVIYLANGDQIRDPNKIYPGQVFRMPKDDAAVQ